MEVDGGSLVHPYSTVDQEGSLFPWKVSPRFSLLLTLARFFVWEIYTNLSIDRFSESKVERKGPSFLLLDRIVGKNIQEGFPFSSL